MGLFTVSSSQCLKSPNDFYKTPLTFSAAQELTFPHSNIYTSSTQFSNGTPPTSFNSWFSTSTALDPSSICQLDTLTSQYDAMATTIQSLSDDHKTLSHSFQMAQDNITWAFAHSTAVYATSNLVTAVQFELTSLQQSLTTLQLMLLMATNDRAQLHIQDSINLLSDKIDLATETKDQWATKLHALQSHTLPMLPSNQIPALIASSINIPMCNANPNPAMSSHKHMQTLVDDGDDSWDAENVASQMQVNIICPNNVTPSNITRIYQVWSSSSCSSFK